MKFLPTDRHLNPEEGTSLSEGASRGPSTPPPIGSVLNQLVNEKGQTNQEEQNLKKKKKKISTLGSRN